MAAKLEEREERVEMTMKRGAWLLTLLALAVVPRSAPAQEGIVVTTTQERGWVGVWVDYATADVQGEERTVVVVKEVAEGSPAQEAGIRPGDTLTHLDGQPISPEVFSALGRTLEPGDMVRLTIHRRDGEREVLLEAARRPAEPRLLPPNMGEVVVRLDSVRGAILKNLDSLRLHIARTGSDSAGAVTLRIIAPKPPEIRSGKPTGFSYRMVDPGLDTLFLGPEVFTIGPELALPFEHLVVESAATRELQQELKTVRREITELRRRELARIRELQGALPGIGEARIREDSQIQRIRQEEEALLQRQQELAQRLSKLGETEVKRRWAQLQEEVLESHVDTREAAEAAVEEARREMERTRRGEQERRERSEGTWQSRESSSGVYQLRRPSTIQIVGQSFVAGAQLAPLNPALAEYFQVDDGVLVMEVVEGTPADAAGLVAGDVIVRAGNQEVSSLEELRFGLGYARGPLTVRIIRKGEPLELSFFKEEGR